MSNLDMVALEAAAQLHDYWTPGDRVTLGQRNATRNAEQIVLAYLRTSGIQAEIDGLRSIVQTYSDALREIASDEVETAFMFRLIAKEALEAAVRQGVQMRDRMEEVGNG